MAYAEKVPSPAGGYWRGRFKDPEGRYLTVRDEHGRVIRFTTRKDAGQAASDAESDVRKGRWRDPSAGLVLFAEWAADWYAGLDLAPSTMASIRRHLEEHLLPFFGATALAAIDAAMIARWERLEKAAGYMPSSIRTWRGTLHTCLEDATGRHIAVNPAARRRGRGKRSGRKAGRRGPEKVITSPLGALLIAERMAVLSGRDDEFVLALLLFWYQLRLGEAIGLERAYVRPAARLRVEWQLHEVEGTLLRCPPKDESYGSLDHPPFMARLLSAHLARVKPEPCPCHGQAYAFRGMGAPRRGGTVPLRVVAEAAGVSETAAAAALGGRGRVGDGTRRRVEEAARAAGWEPLPASGPAWHWRRSSFEELFTAAASGRLPARQAFPRRPVPLAGDWPGTRVRGRNAQGRAEFCWLPVAQGLTPHGLRHSGKTWMEEARVPEVLSEERLRHEIPGISGAYRHVTPAMRIDLLHAMTGAWEAALGERLEMSPRSPVAVLAALLDERLEARKPRAVPRNSPEDAVGVLPFPVGTPSDLGRGGRI